jgi:hypothetical protein
MVPVHPHAVAEEYVRRILNCGCASLDERTFHGRRRCADTLCCLVLWISIEITRWPLKSGER